MRILVAIVLLLCLAAGAAWNQARHPGSCWDRARTQAAMNACASADSARAEAELSRSYGLLLARAAKANAAAVPKIKAAQQAWIAYREAQIEAMFAADDKQISYGSVYPMCILLLRTQLAAQRIRELHVMLSAPASGVVCSGDRYASANPQ